MIARVKDGAKYSITVPGSLLQVLKIKEDFVECHLAWCPIVSPLGEHIGSWFELYLRDVEILDYIPVFESL